MSEVTNHLVGKVKSLTEKNKALLDGAEKSNRDMTDDETAEFKTNMK